MPRQRSVTWTSPSNCPRGGDPFDWDTAPTITSFKGDGVDLLANGAGFLKTEWSGDYDRDDTGYPYFRTGGGYTLTVQLMFGSGYCAAGTKSSTTGEVVVSTTAFSATVNGVAADVGLNSSSYYPRITVNLKLEGEVLSAAEKAEKDEAWEALKQTRRAMLPSRTRAEAETYNRDNAPEKVVVVTDPEGRDLMANRENMTTAVFNVSTADEMADDVVGLECLKEIWLSPEVDVRSFLRKMKQAQRNVIRGLYYYEYMATSPMYLSEGTVFIPESSVSEFKQDCEFGYAGGAFCVKYYSGSDVVAAQKAGASAAKEICTTHTYTDQICSADRTYTVSGCEGFGYYYYSCKYCGKCENNPNHVDHSWTIKADPAYAGLVSSPTTHSSKAELPADSVYVGVNAAGNHVWYNSCEFHGVSDPYDVSQSVYKATGTQLSYADWKVSYLNGRKYEQTQALNSTERYPGMFTLPLKSDAKMSTWAQSDVNLALNDDLIDDAILGKDYTNNITRLQFCSVAVKLAETLIGKELTPAASTFTDTDNVYVLKAYAAGITTGTGNGAFSPDGTLTRAQMATFIYRTLRYVEQNSDYKYTDYTSKLANYTDSGAVQGWATEAMAFMNALDLIKGTTDTTLNPDGLCTIEQAVAVAERSVYAHLIGWYQVGYASNHTSMDLMMDGYYLREGDYIWVTGRRYGTYNTSVEAYMNLPYVDVPALNPFNGQASDMTNGALIPVRN